MIIVDISKEELTGKFDQEMIRKTMFNNRQAMTSAIVDFSFYIMILFR